MVLGVIWESFVCHLRTKATQEAPDGPGLNKWCLSQLESKSSISMLILHVVFEGQITNYYKLRQKKIPGSVDETLKEPRPLSNSVRTPTDNLFGE